MTLYKNLAGYISKMSIYWIQFNIRELSFISVKCISSSMVEGEGPIPIISASDLEKYGYCPLSWWLSIGLSNDNEEDKKRVLATGTEKHKSLSKDLNSILEGESMAKESETTVLWFAIAATLICLVGLSLVFKADLNIGLIMGVIALIWILAACYFLYLAETISQKKTKMIYQRIILIFAIVGAIIGVNSLTVLERYFSPEGAEILLALSLVWLIAASYFLYRSLKHVHGAMKKRHLRKVKEQIAYVDTDDKKPKLFISKKLGLSGRPDYVLLIDDGHIPVEVKTGRTPRGPLFSHIMQTAAYCILIDEEYGEAPPYGILRYETAEHEIEYDDSLKDLVITKLEEMRNIFISKEVHRNHNKPGKCRNCSRRAICQERLD